MDRQLAQVSETHIGIVFLVGDRAYKLKKPVDLGFLDFSTRERRLEACRREVDLNRRLAPDVYLGIADVHDEHGNPCDHLVVMRRMPAQRRLSTLIAAGAPLGPEIRALARLLAAFHAGARRSAAITEQGGRDALSGRWEDSFEQVERVAGDVLPAGDLDRVRRLVRAFLAGRGPLLSGRQAHGRIVDGHGDLIAQDVFCLDDGPRVLDCLEFNDLLRWLDGLDDAAFLAMDLEHHGRPDLASAFLDAYAEFSGDPAPPSLRHHYVAYRAFVRTKVACLRHVQGEQTAHAEARAYTDLALAHLHAGAVRLVLVGGLPGTGKSTLAGRLADRLGAVLLSSDRVRKELAGLPPERHAAAAYRAGIYAPQHSARCYHELVHRAGELLALGESVVLDASWSRAADRDAAAKIAARTHSDLVELHCVAPPDVAAKRILARAGTGTSDADPAIAAAMAADAEPWPAAVTVPTTGSPDEAVATALAAIDAAPFALPVDL
ncbi:MAG TPA: AAA family ATPase, partial [Pseudonocardiaceae bacterium]|nr:AAA family ATPase [Pseudonocardiaceae bacterium]